MSIEIRNIMMPVRAINECCKNCPELEIDISRYEMSDLPFTNRRISTFEMGNHNILACKHAQRCERMMIWMESKQEEVKTL